MTNLGEFFPEHLKSSFLQRVVVIRAVIKLFAEETTPPKPKRFVIIGENKAEFGLIILNTDINTNVYPEGTPGNQLQIELKKTPVCSYLEHTSYADCTRIFTYNKNDTIEVLSSKQDQILGKMLDDHWIAVFKAVKTSKAISFKTKKEFGIL